MNKSTNITIVQILLLSLGISLLFTSLILMGGLFLTESFWCGSAGLWCLALVYLSNRF